MPRWFRRNRKKDKDEEAGEDGKAKDEKDKEDKDKDKTASDEKRRTDKLAEEAREKFVDFFGNKPPPTKAEREQMQKDKATQNSWRNITATFFTFVVFIYAFVLQIWIISRSVEASKVDPAKDPINGLGDYTSSFPIDTYTRTQLVLTTDLNGDYTSYLTKVTITTTETTSRRTSTPRRSTATATATALVENNKAAAAMNAVARPTANPSSATQSHAGHRSTSAVPSASKKSASKAQEGDDDDDDMVSWLRKRTLNGGNGAVTNLTAQCLYVNGSELAKRGGFAVALSILYNMWIMVFIIILLGYERKRLRLSRKAHSAAVIGTIQIWLATDYFSRGVETQLVLAATGIYICAFINLLYGLPETHLKRESLFPYLLGRPERVGPPVRATQYEAPKAAGELYGEAKGLAEKLGVQADALGETDFKGPAQLTAAYLNPGALANLTQEEREKVGGVIRPGVAERIPGGGATLAHVGNRGNQFELLREVLLPKDGAGGGGGGGSGNKMENVMTAMMVMNMMNQMGGNMMGGPGRMNPMMGGPGMGMAPGGMGMGMNPMMGNPAMGYNPYGTPGLGTGMQMNGMTGLAGGLGGKSDPFADRYFAKHMQGTGGLLYR